MNLLANILLAVSCLVAGHAEPACLQPPVTMPHEVARAQDGPIREGDALDVVISAQAAIAWDRLSGKILYDKNADERRPVASLVKLLSSLITVEHLAPDAIIEIPAAVRAAQRLGAHIRLPVGEHVRVDDLLAASLIASANDAIVALAQGTAGSEEKFVMLANQQTKHLGLPNTKLANVTGLPGGEQYSTATDIRHLLTLVFENPRLGHYLNDEQGTLTSQEGTIRHYKSTDDLLSTYLPILAAKTGYTEEAGENVALFTQAGEGSAIGIVILGSAQRFQDAKILAEWINRHYTWPHNH